jgi:hypothetical protein
MASLHSAAAMGQTQLLVSLLRDGADPDGRDADDLTALHVAAALGQTSAAAILLQAGASPAAAASSGATPLSAAAAAGNDVIVAALLACGCDPEPRDQRGRTPIEIARAHGHELVAAVLERHTLSRAPVTAAAVAEQPQQLAQQDFPASATATAAPSGGRWSTDVSRRSGETYYVNLDSGETAWELPPGAVVEAEEVAAAPAPVAVPDARPVAADLGPRRAHTPTRPARPSLTADTSTNGSGNGRPAPAGAPPTAAAAAQPPESPRQAELPPSPHTVPPPPPPRAGGSPTSQLLSHLSSSHQLSGRQGQQRQPSGAAAAAAVAMTPQLLEQSERQLAREGEHARAREQLEAVESQLNQLVAEKMMLDPLVRRAGGEGTPTAAGGGGGGAQGSGGGSSTGPAGPEHSAPIVLARSSSAALRIDGLAQERGALRQQLESLEEQMEVAAAAAAAEDGGGGRSRQPAPAATAAQGAGRPRRRRGGGGGAGRGGGFSTQAHMFGADLRAVERQDKADVYHLRAVITITIRPPLDCLRLT